MTEQVNAHGAAAGAPPKSVDEVAVGFLRVANEAMCRPIRALTQMKGHDVSRHVLACFGGAGGQHACAIAVALGIRTVFVHRYSGILSAVGIGLAQVVKEAQVACCDSVDWVAVHGSRFFGWVNGVEELRKKRWETCVPVSVHSRSCGGGGGVGRGRAAHEWDHSPAWHSASDATPLVLFLST